MGRLLELHEEDRRPGDSQNYDEDDEDGVRHDGDNGDDDDDEEEEKDGVRHDDHYVL